MTYISHSNVFCLFRIVMTMQPKNETPGDHSRMNNVKHSTPKNEENVSFGKHSTPILHRLQENHMEMSPDWPCMFSDGKDENLAKLSEKINSSLSISEDTDRLVF